MKLTKQHIPKFTQHVLLWLLFVVMPPIIIAPFLLTVNPDGQGRFYFMFFYSSVILLLVFYLNYFYLVPKFYIPKKRLYYFLSIVVIIFLVVASTRMIVGRAGLLQNHQMASLKGTMIGFAFFRLLLVFFVSGGLVVYERWQQTEKEKLKAEVAFLKAQINPHFLFNTLNGIYTLAIKKSDLTSDSIAKLSAIMQYAASDSSKEKISLEKEIAYLSDYIDLQKLRLTQNTTISFSIEGDASLLQIEPMLLISFIENAFKYGVSTEHKSSIDIFIKIKPQELQFVVRNHKVRTQTSLTESGIGLENTIQRLKNAYTNLHTLNIKEDAHYYSVHLTLHLI